MSNSQKDRFIRGQYNWYAELTEHTIYILVNKIRKKPKLT